MNDSSAILNSYLLEFNPYLEKFIRDLFVSEDEELATIFRYHLGLDDPAEKRGKHIRSLLTLICCDGAGADWRIGLPAATAIELVHNFSLIHDDIEDNGEYRRGKEAVWKRWGLEKALNAGDAMYASAFLALNALRGSVQDSVVLDANDLLSATCLKLTKGQQMDIGFENRDCISEHEYLEMIKGKTAALIACSAQMGALIAGLGIQEQENYAKFGESLGIAFQIYDDWLGIWGDPVITGKTATGDIVERKKSLPILLGLEKSPRFSEKFENCEISSSLAKTLAKILEEDGIETVIRKEYSRWTHSALETIKNMKCTESSKEVLTALTNKLLIRTK